MSDEPVGDAGPGIAASVAGLLRDVPDFPTPGIVFKDIAPLLASPVFGTVIRALAAAARDGDGQIDGHADGQLELVAGVEARGFLLAGAVATILGCGVVPVRKAGKLPPPTIARAYALEYGEATIEVPVHVLDGKRVYLVDDVLATGGTLRAAADLIAAAGGQVRGIGVLLELGFLDGRAVLGDVAPLHALLRV
jgi:adenine phosphoribosyltransferase